jgi:hypothetical protein
LKKKSIAQNLISGHNLSRVAHLLNPSYPYPLFDPDQPDTDLVLVLNSPNRLIKQARESLGTDRINVLGHQRINGFPTRRTTSHVEDYLKNEKTHKAVKADRESIIHKFKPSRGYKPHKQT